MDNATWLGLIGIIIIIMQIIGTAVVCGVRADVKNLWSRVNTHGHDVDCSHDNCKPVTKGVILRDAG